MRTQAVGVSRHDLPLGACGCGPRLEEYEQELGRVRGELGEKVKVLECLREELRALQVEHAGTLEELAESRKRAESGKRERAAVVQEVCILFFYTQYRLNRMVFVWGYM